MHTKNDNYIIRLYDFIHDSICRVPNSNTTKSYILIVVYKLYVYQIFLLYLKLIVCFLSNPVQTYFISSSDSASQLDVTRL